jgi:hypothetical protein
METWWDMKKVNNDLHLQFYCIYTNNNENLSNFHPSSFRTLSRENIFFRLLKLSHRSSEMFRKRMTTQYCQPWQSHVCVRACVCVCVYVSIAPVFTRNVLRPSQPFSSFSGKCFANTMTTLWSMLLTWATICWMLDGRKPYRHFHSGSWRENKQLQCHFKQTVTFQFRYMSLPLPPGDNSSAVNK